MLRIGKILNLVSAPLAIFGFWSAMGAAAHAYPDGYDWRYQTISVLLYPDQNPSGYRWAWSGLWICALAGIAWTAELTARLQSVIPERSAAGFRLLQIGFLCMSCAILPDRLIPWPKGHELFAVLSFLAICVGITREMFVAVARRETYHGRGMFGATRTTIRRIVALFPLVPLVFAGATQAYLRLVRPDLPWVTRSWRALGVPPFLSFGLWEWVSCAVLSVCLVVLWMRSLAAPRGAK